MQGRISKLRAIAMLATGSIVVHELRYVVGYGGSAGEALAEQGHSYMPMVESLAIVLAAIALARFCAAIVRARGGAVGEPAPPGFASLWLGASATLAAVYTVQEGLEGAFAPGHPVGIVGVFGHWGWTALLFSLVLGAAIALVARVAHHAIELVARSATRSRDRRSAPVSRPVWRALAWRRIDVLALNLAGRAPPAS
jgi:hypothetical protein